MLKSLLKSLVSGFGFSFAVLISIVSYRTWTDLRTVNPGDLLSSSSWNALISKVNNIGARTDAATGFKNYIINGNFDVWQRGTSQTTTSYGSDDRWANMNIGSTKTHSQVICSDTERALFSCNYFSRTVVTSVVGAGNSVLKTQNIEDVTKLAGKTLVLSFWAKADSNKDIGLRISQNFGLGGTPSSGVDGIAAQKISLTNSWQKYKIVFNMPSIVGKTLGTTPYTSFSAVSFGFDMGSTYSSLYGGLGQQSGTFDLAQIQLENGPIATAFEQRPYGLELSLCQRYFERIDFERTSYISYGYLNASNNQWITIPFSVKKRIVPAITNPTFQNSTPGSIYIGTSYVSYNGSTYFYIGAGTYLFANAEL